MKTIELSMNVENDYEELSQAVANQVIQTVKQNPEAWICIAGGDTPVRAMEIIVEASAKQELSFSKCSFVELDEWKGLGKNDEGSCYYILNNHLFSPLGLRTDQIHVFNAVAPSLTEECGQMIKVLEKAGGLDLIVLGIGRNGHLGFNEPGSNFNSSIRVVELDNTTTEVGEKYFNNSKVVPPSRGITLGVKQILEADKAILMASGSKKAEIVKQFWAGPISRSTPASVLKLHKNCMVFLDEEASEYLNELEI
ncbi:glucosamine-6-phosphate deaminase [Marinococcus sp. PL1-022]|uniref:glucosamine-6-phosphate deaminase n=1 Tax=Marinococcus sp. PL1-022 TaxID=3095363 RepID=UPI0029C16063|nr:glucosamine-6-phosphate deaminase [Marinococcus sp. PL1-022]MDX6152583.1 glucosamine-6-phosphate deaminase [Marinococcus sp. PL1-022]